MRILMIYILVIILILGCSDSRTKSQDEQLLFINQIDNDYQERKNFFTDEFVNHFPRKLDTNYITFTDCASPDVGPITLRLINRYNDINRINKIIDNSIAHYASDDSCLLIVNRFATKDRFYKIKLTNEEKETIDKECYKDKLPIPNFWNSQIISERTDTKLPEDFIIYVLNSKKGKFVKPEQLTDGSFMPAAWKNGYSKGIAISEKRKIIIYWIDIW